VQQELDHDKSGSLEGKRSNLAEETEELKVDLSVRSWASAGNGQRDLSS
jgi:hypothetical protein